MAYSSQQKTASLNLFIETGAIWLLPLAKFQIKAIVLAMLDASGCKAIDLHLTCDYAIARLNREFLKCNGPTNVLTFPNGSSGGAIFISLDCLERECLFYGQNRQEHFLRLLAHGFGHLQGLDHGSELAAIESVCFKSGMQVIS